MGGGLGRTCAAGLHSAGCAGRLLSAEAGSPPSAPRQKPPSAPPARAWPHPGRGEVPPHRSPLE
eukprot:12495178-Alexandrium_andersonii.AAC.1